MGEVADSECCRVCIMTKCKRSTLNLLLRNNVSGATLVERS